MAGKFELKKSSNDQFMFNLKAANGQVILTSELYREKGSAQNGIESVKKHAGDDANYERRSSSKGEPYFVLKAANGQIIGMSEIYSSTSAMENGIASVKANAPDAEVVDLAIWQRAGLCGRFRARRAWPEVDDSSFQEYDLAWIYPWPRPRYSLSPLSVERNLQWTNKRSYII